MAWRTLPAARNQTGLDSLRLFSKQVLAALPARGGGKFVLRTDGGKRPRRFLLRFQGGIRGGERCHRAVELRRTASTLMSRAKTPADHGERCRGHVNDRGRIYDLFEDRDEKVKAYGGPAGPGRAHHQSAGG
jgi:hypothetical protein